jgi:hypothetical protein
MNLQILVSHIYLYLYTTCCFKYLLSVTQVWCIVHLVIIVEYIPNVAAKWLALLLGTWEVTGSNLCLKTSCRDRFLLVVLNPSWQILKYYFKLFSGHFLP